LVLHLWTRKWSSVGARQVEKRGAGPLEAVKIGEAIVDGCGSLKNCARKGWRG